MEDNEDNNIKIVIRLKGVIVFLIVVILSMVIAVVFYKMNTENKKKIDELSNYSNTIENEKQSFQGEVKKLKEKNKKLEDEAKELREKNKKLEDEVEKWKGKLDKELGDDYTKEVEFGFKEAEDSNEYYDGDISSIPREDIENLISNFMKIYLYQQNSNIKFLVDLGLTDSNKIENYKLVIDSYYETDIKFDDYKKLLLNYMTKECFNDEFYYEKKEKDGVLYYSKIYSYPSGLTSYEIKNIKKGEEENEYKVTVIDKYDDEQEEYEYIVGIVQKDGKPLVYSVYF